MSSTYARAQIVTDALQLAGRGQELKQSCNQWLNYFLLHVGLTFRFPELRKVGTQLTLYQGTSTVALPLDLGSGMENQGMIFGPDNKPLSELSFEDFVSTDGFPPPGQNVGRPYLYMVDKEAQVFRFNKNADTNYLFTPVYFKQPPLLSVQSTDDAKMIWIDDDLLAVQGLIWVIYQFTNDDREMKQADKVWDMINTWKREQVKLGGTSRVMPSPARFKTVKFGGYYGP